MLEQILLYLFIVTGFINVSHIGMYLVGANIYDMKVFKRGGKHKLPKQADRPLVSVIIPAYNEAQTINRTLRSTWNSSYNNIEVVVVNDGSKDNTSGEVRRFISSRSRNITRSKIVRTKNGFKRSWQRGPAMESRRIQLVEQSNKGKAAALNNGMKNHSKGELVMTLDADSVLHQDAVKNTVKHFNADSKVAGVAANVRIIEEPTMIGMLQRFEHMIAYRSKKFFSVANCEMIIGGVASTYRRDILKKVGYYDTDTITEDIGLSMKVAALGNKDNKLVYAADVAAMTEGVPTFNMLLTQRYRWKLGMIQNLFKYRQMAFSKDRQFSRMLTWYRFPMAFLGELLILLEPIALAYIAYLSIKYIGGPLLFVGAYTTITLYVLLVVWHDEHLDFKGRIKTSLLAPVVYFVFYIMNIVQLASAVRVALNSEKVYDSKKRESTWVSPKRSGRQVSFSS